MKAATTAHHPRWSQRVAKNFHFDPLLWYAALPHEPVRSRRFVRREDWSMIIRRLPHAVVALATLVAPLVARAQAAPNGSVTTAPFAPGAPVMGLPVLALLAVVLAGVAAYFLRRATGRGVAGLAVLAVLGGLVGLGYATLPSITIQGAQCATSTTQVYDAFFENTLVSHCPNPISIVSIQQTCTLVAGPGGGCRAGQVLTNGASCNLPTCDLCIGVVCTAQDQCHVAGTCDPSTGQCSNPAATDGTGCNDSNVCTQNDVCTAGVCGGTPQSDGTTCDAGTDAAQTQICTSGTCGGCTANLSASPRFVDNGNGTITDRYTCLVWEKKDQSGGIHDWGNTYTWSTGDNNPDGTAFTTFLATLNMGSGFAGHHDWRLPSEDGQNPPNTGPKELESILAAPYPCTGKSNPCVDVAFNTNCMASCSATGASSCSCTQSNFYWSATTYAGNPYDAWGVYFTSGYVGIDVKTGNLYVRAVRGGL